MNTVTKICPLCKTSFEPSRHDQVYCDDCRLNHMKELRAQQHKQKKLNKEKKRNRNKSLQDILTEIDEYNKANNCFISYGKYVAMMENGEV